MKFFLLFCTLIAATTIATGQQIEFKAADPHPNFPGALMGDMDFADVDSDGDQDLFICGRKDGWTSNDASGLYLNDGSGQFTIDQNSTFPSVQFAAAIFSDLDGDGDKDFLLSGRGDLSEKVGDYYLNDGQGGFTLSTNLPLEPCENGGFQLGDVDGDGDLDVFQFGERGNVGEAIPFIKLFSNLGNGEFQETPTPQFQAFNALHLVDLDGDSDLDLVMRFIVPDTRSTDVLFQNDGSGNFSIVARPTFSDLTNTYLTIGDLDGDRDADFLVSGTNTASESITEFYLSDGNWNYSLFGGNNVFPDLSTGENAFYDLDNDGDLDILMSGTRTGGLNGGIITNIIENQGNNSYVLADSLTGSYFSNNAVGDMNGDGLLDLVLSGTTVGNPTFKTWAYFNDSQVTSSLREQGQSLDVISYPNPTSGPITLEVKSNEQLSIELFNATGQRVWAEQFQGPVAEINLIQPAGIYLLQIQVGNEVLTQRVQIIK